jgi:hypothetical protein
VGGQVRAQCCSDIPFSEGWGQAKKSLRVRWQVWLNLAGGL